ncbi:MAG: hypothetical protein QM811_00815 [Pirellulales bacterium]
MPVYGPLNVVPPGDTAKEWLTGLLKLNLDDPLEPWTVMQLARKTDDRYRDVGPRDRTLIVDHLRGRHADEHLISLVAVGGALDAEEQARSFGEALPKGLRIV